ncbi:OLC1v1035673C1 [Oldenlandia corymbosa var. corymbosa]|uniref:OLC1v1035673C1 n=1 Tax=Oldenlandia corymbosa var. corymbosa TaxID=529605 RepID=A0AAV1CW24_OLDCO|nr:OLC1v1035673C1 [Oldenlandia corymbosa var. corymbosa]
MATKLNLLSFFLVIILMHVGNISSSFSPETSSSTTGIKGGYWPSWKADKVPPSAIPTGYFTHIFYAFATLNPETYSLNITPSDKQWMPVFTNTIHSKSPSVKTMLSIGGAAANLTVFSMMSAKKEHRTAFINSTIDVARKYGFDGLDLDWEFPGTPREMNKLVYLFRDWRNAATEESISSGKPALLITAAVYYTTTVTLNTNIPRVYPGYRIGEYVDFLNPMCYDYHGGWEPTLTGANALLYDKSSNVSTSYGISTWKSSGINPEQIAMGLAIYGRSWTLSDLANNGIGAPATSVGPGVQGVLGYNEILKFNAAFDATVVFDKTTVSTYSYSGTTWVGYDDVLTIILKVKFAKAQGLGGYFFWALDTDDNWSISRAASMAWDGEI